MKTIVTLLLCTLLLIIFGGCQTTGGERQTVYPAEIRGIEESPNYPIKAASFKRAKIMTYAPGMTNISMSYNHQSLEAQISATIYVYKKSDSVNDIRQEYEAEKINIKNNYPDAKLLNEGGETFIKNGKKFVAFKAQYEFDDIFMRKSQKVYSQLMLIEHDGKYIKLRSTAPRDQKDVASHKNLELMNAVNWAN